VARDPAGAGCVGASVRSGADARASGVSAGDRLGNVKGDAPDDGIDEADAGTPPEDADGEVTPNCAAPHEKQQARQHQPPKAGDGNKRGKLRALTSVYSHMLHCARSPKYESE